MGNEGNKFKWVGTRQVRPDGVDKVTGQATYGADFVLPGMITGKVLRSPHAHARIRSIDTSAAAALPGVRAIVTAADFPDLPSEVVTGGEAPVNYRHVSCNRAPGHAALRSTHQAVPGDSATVQSLPDRRSDRDGLPA